MASGATFVWQPSGITLQLLFGYLAIATSVVCLVLVLKWSEGEDTAKKYLGGVSTLRLNSISFHVRYMVSAVAFCLVNSLMSYRLFPISHFFAKCLHFCWHAGAIGCIIAGLRAITYNHNVVQVVSNLTSLHSWLGIATITIFGQNFLLGFFHFVLPITSMEWKMRYMYAHKFLGLLALFAAVATVTTGVINYVSILGCNYPEDPVEDNPASYYTSIPQGCRIANGLGITFLLTVILVTISIWNFPKVV